jgi:hypothetical protein
MGEGEYIWKVEKRDASKIKKNQTREISLV